MTKMQTSRRRFLGAVGAMGLAAGVAATVSACGGDNPNKQGSSGGSGGAKANKEGTIKAAISYELGTNGYDPMTTTSALALAANWHTLEGLTEVMPTGDREVYAALAKDMPRQINPTTYEVELRDGAKFHDGSDVTPEDVAFSFERVMDPANESLYVNFIPFIDRVEPAGDKKVKIVLNEPFALLNERLSTVKIVPKAAVEKGKDAFDANPVGSGPYKMTDNGGSSNTVKFERNEYYTGPLPANAAAMNWEIIPDESTRTNALTSSKVQAIDSVPYLSINSLKSKSTVESVQGFGLLFAMFNNGQKPFSELKNRQGVMHAFQIDKVIETAFLGNAAAATCFVHDTHPTYKRASVVYNGDAEKAKQLFSETGLKNIRMLATDHDWVRKATPILKESLENVGINVDFTESKSADVYNTIDGKPDAFDLVVAPGDPSVFGNDADLLMRWWYATDVWTDNRMHWKGTDTYKTVQSLLDKAASQTGDAQVKTWHQIYDLLSEQVPLYPLLHRKVPTAWNDESLVDFKPISLTGLSFLDVGTTK